MKKCLCVCVFCGAKELLNSGDSYLITGFLPVKICRTFFFGKHACISESEGEGGHFWSASSRQSSFCLRLQPGPVFVRHICCPPNQMVGMHMAWVVMASEASGRLFLNLPWLAEWMCLQPLCCDRLIGSIGGHGLCNQSAKPANCFWRWEVIWTERSLPTWGYHHCCCCQDKQRHLFCPSVKRRGEGEEENTREKFPNCLPLVNCQTCCHGKVCGTQEVLEITTCIAHLFSIAICPEHQVSKYTI